MSIPARKNVIAALVKSNLTDFRPKVNAQFPSQPRMFLKIPNACAAAAEKRAARILQKKIKC